MSTWCQLLNRALVTLLLILAGATAGAQDKVTLQCGNASYDDGESTDFDWFGGGDAGDPDRMFAVFFSLADFGYEPGFVEITGICAGNLLAVGGLFPNDVYVYPDNEGAPDDTVTLAVARILTGNGRGASIVEFDRPVTLHGDFWLVNRGNAALTSTDFNMEHDEEPTEGHSYVSEDGIAELEETEAGDYMLRAYLRPTDRSYLTAGMARTSGANDTEWRSQLAILNVGERAVEATASFRAAGSDPIEITGTIATGQLLAWDDVLGELFEVTDELAGSIQVDGDGPLVVTARTYNQSDVGTLGQFLPGIAPEQAMATGEVGVLSPLASNQQFRTNVGYINLSDHACEIRVILHDATGLQIGSERVRSIDPSGWKQDNDIFAATGAGNQDHAYAMVDVLTNNCAMWVYASVVDNATGDPTMIPLVIQ
jgi:hypothetical protein